MRRRHWLAALGVALAALSAPAAAGADVLDVYQQLASRGLSPAPLVPTAVPPSVRPYDRTVGLGSTRGGRGYALRIVHYGRNGPDAIVVVTGGEFKTMRALLRDHRRLGFDAPRRTRIRGHRGYLITRRLGPLVRTLAWVEGGTVYSVGSGTPRKVSLADLRSTARRLDRLGRDWIGGSGDPDSSSEASAVTTERTVTVHVSFEATCAPPGNPDAAIARVGQAAVTLLRRDGDGFSFDIAQNRRGSDEVAWTARSRARSPRPASRCRCRRPARSTATSARPAHWRSRWTAARDRRGALERRRRHRFVAELDPPPRDVIA